MIHHVGKGLGDANTRGVAKDTTPMKCCKKRTRIAFDYYGAHLSEDISMFLYDL